MLGSSAKVDVGEELEEALRSGVVFALSQLYAHVETDKEEDAAELSIQPLISADQVQLM